MFVCMVARMVAINGRTSYISCSFFGRPFVKRFALCYLLCLSVTVYYGQTVGWIKMKLGMQEGLGPGHIVLHGNPALLPKKESEPPFFGPCLLRPNGWMHQDATWCGGWPHPRRLCVRWGPSPSQKGAEPFLQF